jgi:serine/threonine protein kinase
MAPEYLLDGLLDARADLFALGVIAHELLVGRPLFQGRDDMDTLFRIRDLVVEPPSSRNRDVPPEIDAIVMTALERDPDKRWQRASALRMALTAETMKLGLVAHNTQVLEWIDWAFEQTATDDDSPEIEISTGTTELRTQDASQPPLRPSLPTVSERPPAPLLPASGARTLPFMAQAPVAVATLIGIGASPLPDVQRSSAQRAADDPGNPFVLGLLVLIAASAAAAVVYFAMP